MQALHLDLHVLLEMKTSAPNLQLLDRDLKYIPLLHQGPADQISTPCSTQWIARNCKNKGGKSSSSCFNCLTVARPTMGIKYKDQVLHF